MSLVQTLFGEYRLKVLGLILLNPEKSFHVREIARQTGTTPGTLARELKKMSEEGVLLKTPIGNQVHYSADRTCPIYEELASIFRKTNGLLGVLSQGLVSLSQKIKIACVFGSVASGQANKDSDIDLLVIGDVTINEIVKQMFPLQEILGREINPKVYSPPEWQKLLNQKRAFSQEIIDKPKLFVIGTEQDLLMGYARHGR